MVEKSRLNRSTDLESNKDKNRKIKTSRINSNVRKRNIDIKKQRRINQSFVGDNWRIDINTDRQIDGTYLYVSGWKNIQTDNILKDR